MDGVVLWRHESAAQQARQWPRGPRAQRGVPPDVEHEARADTEEHVRRLGDHAGDEPTDPEDRTEEGSPQRVAEGAEAVHPLEGVVRMVETIEKGAVKEPMRPVLKVVEGYETEQKSHDAGDAQRTAGRGPGGLEESRCDGGDDEWSCGEREREAPHVQ